MWYPDPRDARRSARQARRASRYRYRRSGGSIIGTIILLLSLLYVFTPVWAWVITGIVIVVLAAFVLGLLHAGTKNTWFGQQPPQQPYQPYGQGYQGMYQEGGQQYQHSPQSAPANQQHQEPHVDYPGQTPPMQQQ